MKNITILILMMLAVFALAGAVVFSVNKWESVSLVILRNKAITDCAQAAVAGG